MRDRTHGGERNLPAKTKKGENMRKENNTLATNYEWKTRKLAGNKCKVAVYGGMMRLHTESGFASTQLSAMELSEKLNTGVDFGTTVTRYKDGSFTVGTQRLIPWDMPDDDIQKLVDEIDTSLEEALGLPVGESVTSGSWNAGHDETTYDMLLSNQEDCLITGK